ncbi:Tm-1-like ATP-binding domain-containing protein [Streptomyces sp. S1D4-11]|nr:Tm-1-like ATP-binding domain-containing protein [Streptomyces sp. S1D4-11]
MSAHARQRFLRRGTTGRHHRSGRVGRNLCCHGSHEGAALEAAAEADVPQMVSVGALDMCGFGPLPNVPSAYAARTLVQHDPDVMLTRTIADENVGY